MYVCVYKVYKRLRITNWKQTCLFSHHVTWARERLIFAVSFAFRRGIGDPRCTRWRQRLQRRDEQTQGAPHEFRFRKYRLLFLGLGTYKSLHIFRKII